jgi:hypothetical protein
VGLQFNEALGSKVPERFAQWSGGDTELISQGGNHDLLAWAQVSAQDGGSKLLIGPFRSCERLSPANSPVCHSHSVIFP